MCFGCSKEPSHRDDSFEYPQHMFWLRNKKNNFQLRTLIWRPGDAIRFVFLIAGNNRPDSETQVTIYRNTGRC